MYVSLFDMKLVIGAFDVHTPTTVHEATRASLFEDTESMGARDPNYNIKAYEENVDV